MSNKHSFFVDPIKGTVSVTTTMILIVVSVCLISMAEYTAAAIFGVLGILFLPQIWQYLTLVCFDETGARSSFCGYTKAFFPWDQIGEVCIAGSRVFGAKKKRGTLYIYLSPNAMTDDEHFQMLLRFPPREKITLIYTDKAYKALRLYWDGPVCSYNTGERTGF